MVIIKDIVDIMSRARGTMVSDDFTRVNRSLSGARESVREKIQELTSKRVKEIISKLESGGKLNDEDISLMKVWIVGDAESYTTMENDFDNWLVEFDRLVDVIKGYDNRDLTGDECFKLQGVLEDAFRVSDDILRFLEKQERISRFNEAVKSPDSLDNELLIKILSRKLQSPEM